VLHFALELRDLDGVVATGLRKIFILLLLGDSNIAWRASPKTAINEELAQVFKRHDIDLRRTKRHVSASAGVKHPARSTMTTPGTTWM
jgi:hypothetical protein